MPAAARAPRASLKGPAGQGLRAISLDVHAVRRSFLHEARVHLFRRDHYIAVAWKHRASERDYRLHSTVAYRENQIMEKYFGSTLHRSTFQLDPTLVIRLEREMDPALRYVSPVSAHLITRFSWRQAWTFIVAAWVVLGLVVRYYGREERPREDT